MQLLGLELSKIVMFFRNSPNDTFFFLKSGSVVCCYSIEYSKLVYLDCGGVL